MSISTHSPNFEQELRVALDAAHKASATALQYWRKPLDIHTKSNERDPVTQADLACDSVIRKIILTHFPTHAILSEEDTEEQLNSSDFLWVIDPIDGTVNFTMGSPIFGISIGLLYKHTPVVGVICFPVLEEVYWARTGGGVFVQRKNEPVKECAVSTVNAIPAVRFAAAHYYSDECRQRFYEIFPRIAKQVNAARIHYCGTFDFMSIARGGLDVYINLELALWDYAAAGCIITEAGGTVSNAAGETLPYTSAPQDIVATNAALAPQIPSFFE